MDDEGMEADSSGVCVFVGFLAVGMFVSVSSELALMRTTRAGETDQLTELCKFRRQALVSSQLAVSVQGRCPASSRHHGGSRGPTRLRWHTY